jgi:hypothetical protein
LDRYVLGFVPPLIGLDGSFNTIRLGLAYKKRLTVGDVVFLLDEKGRKVFGEAEVTSVDSATLGEICLLHAEANHMELENKDGQQSARLFAYLQKIYGPHIATTTRTATVVYLRRIHEPPVSGEPLHRTHLREVRRPDGS